MQDELQQSENFPCLGGGLSVLELEQWKADYSSPSSVYQKYKTKSNNSGSKRNNGIPRLKKARTDYFENICRLGFLAMSKPGCLKHVDSERDGIGRHWELRLISCVDDKEAENGGISYDKKFLVMIEEKMAAISRELAHSKCNETSWLKNMQWTLQLIDPDGRSGGKTDWLYVSSPNDRKHAIGVFAAVTFENETPITWVDGVRVWCAAEPGTGWLPENHPRIIEFVRKQCPPETDPHYIDIYRVRDREGYATYVAPELGTGCEYGKYADVAYIGAHLIQRAAPVQLVGEARRAHNKVRANCRLNPDGSITATKKIYRHSELHLEAPADDLDDTMLGPRLIVRKTTGHLPSDGRNEMLVLNFNPHNAASHPRDLPLISDRRPSSRNDELRDAISEKVLSVPATIDESQQTGLFAEQGLHFRPGKSGNAAPDEGLFGESGGGSFAAAEQRPSPIIRMKRNCGSSFAVPGKFPRIDIPSIGGAENRANSPSAQ